MQTILHVLCMCQVVICSRAGWVRQHRFNRLNGALSCSLFCTLHCIVDTWFELQTVVPMLITGPWWPACSVVLKIATTMHKARKFHIWAAAELKELSFAIISHPAEPVCEGPHGTHDINPNSGCEVHLQHFTARRLQVWDYISNLNLYQGDNIAHMSIYCQNTSER